MLDFLSPQYAIIIALVFFMLGLAVVACWIRKGRDKAAPGERQGVLTETCCVCHKEMVFALGDLVPLLPVEMGLAVRGDPRVLGQKLAEFVCPYCEAAHFFSMAGKHPTWVAVNLYEGQDKTANCQECGQRLRQPPWPAEQYDGRLTEVQPLSGDYGLTCERCGASCCVKCCQGFTRNLTEDGSLLCPRCTRGPLAKFFHP